MCENTPKTNVNWLKEGKLLLLLKWHNL